MRFLHLLPIGGMELGVGIICGLTVAVWSIIETGDADTATATGVATAVKVSMAIWMSLFISLKLLDFIAHKLSEVTERSERISEHCLRFNPAPATGLYRTLGSMTIFCIYAIPVTIAVLIWSAIGLLLNFSGALNTPLYWSIPYWLGIFASSLMVLFLISFAISLFFLWTEQRLHAMEIRPEKAVFRTTSFVSRLARVELST